MHVNNMFYAAAIPHYEGGPIAVVAALSVAVVLASDVDIQDASALVVSGVNAESPVLHVVCTIELSPDCKELYLSV